MVLRKICFETPIRAKANLESLFSQGIGRSNRPLGAIKLYIISSMFIMSMPSKTLQINKFDTPLHIKEKTYEFSPEKISSATSYESKTPMVNISNKSALGRCVAFVSEGPIYLRLPEARMLSTAAQLLYEKSHDLTLLVTDAWRSKRRQTKYFDKELDNVRKKNPHFNDERAYRETIRGSADPNFPFHQDGSCVDMSIIDKRGKEIEMGIRDDKFLHETDHTDCTLVGYEAFSNRLILADVMIRAGFTRQREEWWHFDGKGRAWSIVNGEPSPYANLNITKDVKRLLAPYDGYKFNKRVPTPNID